MRARFYACRLFIAATTATLTTVGLAPLSTWRGQAAGVQADEPALPRPPAILVSAFPADPSFDEKGELEHDRPFFSHFAWQAFIALNWPADPTKRGIPSTTKEFGDSSAPVVWGTWKTLDELFLGDPAVLRPSPWEILDDTVKITWAGKPVTPTPSRSGPSNRRSKLLHQTDPRVSAVNQAGLLNADGGHPLVSQFKTLVRYEVHVNKNEYEFIRDNEYYIQEKLPDNNARLKFPDGSVHIAAAWVELQDATEELQKRFYIEKARVLDFDNDGNAIWITRPMGLVGFHIVAKTPKRNDWIWCTFEHVDNLAPPADGSQASFSSNVSRLAPEKPGTIAIPKLSFPYGKPFPGRNSLTPVDVVRMNPIAQSIEAVNNEYQNHPQVKGTVWKNYKLVATQWPKLNGSTRKDEKNRLPGKGVANVTLETYFQDKTCLQCHVLAGQSEFVFYPTNRAYSPPVSNAGN